MYFVFPQKWGGGGDLKMLNDDKMLSIICKVWTTILCKNISLRARYSKTNWGLTAEL